MTRPKQATLLDLLAHDRRPVSEWAASLSALSPLLYPHDAKVSADLANAIRRIVSDAANLDCIRTDDRTAPPIGAPAEDVLEYLFRRWPETRHELNRLLTQADQRLGRREVLRACRQGRSLAR